MHIYGVRTFIWRILEFQPGSGHIFGSTSLDLDLFGGCGPPIGPSLGVPSCIWTNLGGSGPGSGRYRPRFDIHLGAKSGFVTI